MGPADRRSCAQPPSPIGWEGAVFMREGVGGPTSGFISSMTVSEVLAIHPGWT